MSTMISKAGASAPELTVPDPRRWRALAVLGLIQFMLVLDVTVVNVALPRIQHDLGFSRPGLAWVVNGYVLMAGGLLLLGGRLADMFGRRRLFLAGARTPAVPVTWEVMMRKVVAGLFMSLDGVVESPEHWAYQYATSQLWDDMAAGITQADAILLGQRTYRQFAQLWPGQHSDTPMAAFLNTTHKYVVSATLNTLDWGPATLITGDVAAALAELKRQPGKNIQIPGSPTLVRSLLADGLLDELSLTICPVVIGPGMRLFQDMTDRVPLTLAQSKTFSTGALGVTYQPGNA